MGAVSPNVRPKLRFAPRWAGTPAVVGLCRPTSAQSSASLRVGRAPGPDSARAGELFILNRYNNTSLSLGDTGGGSITGLTTMAGCSSADVAAPFGTLDFSDVVSYLTAFSKGCP